jgi:hypothetical protein
MMFITTNGKFLKDHEWADAAKLSLLLARDSGQRASGRRTLPHIAECYKRPRESPDTVIAPDADGLCHVPGIWSEKKGEVTGAKWLKLSY